MLAAASSADAELQVIGWLREVDELAEQCAVEQGLGRDWSRPPHAEYHMANRYALAGVLLQSLAEHGKTAFVRDNADGTLREFVTQHNSRQPG